jgi:thymidylate synthase (FAD)
MEVKLISITQSLIEEKKLSPEELIVYVARVSNPSNQLNTDTSEKLLKYMVKHKHWSPFEMCDMTVEIKTSRAIAAQILRHRSFSFQEFSQRYSEIAEFEPIETRKAGVTNRQSSSEPFDPTILADTKASELIANHVMASEMLYQKLLVAGVAKECARFVLPLSTQTTLYMKGSIRSWIHYLQIRCDENTQKEHQEIAKAILQIFRQNFPTIAKAVFE